MTASSKEGAVNFNLFERIYMISVNRIIRGVMIGSLLLAVAMMATACGGDPKWDYIDEGGNRWPVQDSVATTQGDVLLLTEATHWERCAIKAAVNAIAPVAAAHPEYRLERHDPKYFFARSHYDTIPTICYAGVGCVDSWDNVPYLAGVKYFIDGYYHNVGNQHELILIRGFEMPSLYGEMNFARLLYVVIHEEVHGLGHRYYHGEEMDRVVDLIYSQALNNLATDHACRNIPNVTWVNLRSTGTGVEARRSVD